VLEVLILEEVIASWSGQKQSFPFQDPLMLLPLGRLAHLAQGSLPGESKDSLKAESETEEIEEKLRHVPVTCSGGVEWVFWI